MCSFLFLFLSFLLLGQVLSLLAKIACEIFPQKVEVENKGNGMEDEIAKAKEQDKEGAIYSVGQEENGVTPVKEGSFVPNRLINRFPLWSVGHDNLLRI